MNSEVRSLHQPMPTSLSNLLGHTPLGEEVVVMPDRLVGQHTFITAASGSGKSYTLRRMLEVLLQARRPMFIFDGESEFHSLQAIVPNALIVVGGPQADLPLHPHAAGVMVPELLRKRASVLFDMSEFDNDEQGEIIAAFLGSMMRMPPDLWQPLAVVIDEVQRFAPQIGTSASRKAMEAVARQGRKRGYGLVTASQRISDVSKVVLTQSSQMLVGRIHLRLDIDRVRNEIDLPATMTDGLAMMQPGEFIVRGSAFGDEPIVMKTATTLSDHGTDDHLLAALERPIATAQETIGCLKELVEAEVAKGDAGPAATNSGRQPKAGQGPVRSTRASARSEGSGAAGVDATALDMLAMLAGTSKGRLTLEALAVLVGQSVRSAAFRTALGDLIGRGMVRLGRSSLSLEQHGREVLGDGADAHAVKRRVMEIRSGLAPDDGRVLDILLAAAPARLDKTVIAERVGMSARSRKLGPILSRLSRRGLVRKTGVEFEASAALVELMRR